MMRTSPPAQTARPNLLVDAAPASGVGSTDLATIEGNVVLAQDGGEFVVFPLLVGGAESLQIGQRGEWPLGERRDHCEQEISAGIIL